MPLSFLRDLTDRVSMPSRITHADYLLRLRVTGKVNGSNGKALEGVDIVFVDTGLDDHRSQHPDDHAVVIGCSGKRGAVDVRHRYRWGRGSSEPGSGGGTFAIRLEHEDHASTSFVFDTDALDSKRGLRTVELGTVNLPKG